jgi:hypothetical protein
VIGPGRSTCRGRKYSVEREYGDGVPCLLYGTYISLYFIDNIYKLGIMIANAKQAFSPSAIVCRGTVRTAENDARRNDNGGGVSPPPTDLATGGWLKPA